MVCNRTALDLMWALLHLFFPQICYYLLFIYVITFSLNIDILFQTLIFRVCWMGCGHRSVGYVT